MKTIKAFLALVLVTALTSFAYAKVDEKKADVPTWSIDGAHSSVNFSVRHFFTPVTGKFDDFTGSITFAPDAISESSVNFEIMVSSVDTDNEKRDGHLKTADFFNAEKYPKMTFKSKSFVKKGDNLYHVTGDLTIKEVTKEVTIPVTFLGAKDNPMNPGHKVAGFQLETTIDRNDYNVGTGDYVSDAVIGSEVSITIFVEAHH